MKCDICGKSASTGYAISHSKRHTKRFWMPNIQPVTIVINNKPKQLNLCTRCLRTQYKQPRKRAVPA